MRPAAEVEDLLAEPVGLLLLRMAQRRRPSSRRATRDGDIGDERLHVRFSSGPPNGPFFASASVKPCSVTMHQTSRVSRSMHAIGVGEIARQLRVRALHHARARAEVAAARATRSSARASASTAPRRALPRARPDCRPAAPRGTSRSRRRCCPAPSSTTRAPTRKPRVASASAMSTAHVAHRCMPTSRRSADRRPRRYAFRPCCPPT